MRGNGIFKLWGEVRLQCIAEVWPPSRLYKKTSGRWGDRPLSCRAPASVGCGWGGNVVAGLHHQAGQRRQDRPAGGDRGAAGVSLDQDDRVAAGVPAALGDEETRRGLILDLPGRRPGSPLSRACTTADCLTEVCTTVDPFHGRSRFVLQPECEKRHSHVPMPSRYKNLDQGPRCEGRPRLANRSTSATRLPGNTRKCDSCLPLEGEANKRPPARCRGRGFTNRKYPETLESTRFPRKIRALLATTCKRRDTGINWTRFRRYSGFDGLSGDGS
jgi:hypothetical protein